MNPWYTRTILLGLLAGSLVCEGASPLPVETQARVPVFSGHKSISQVFVQPQVTRYVEGITVLDRRKIFNLCDHGSDFDVQVSREIYIRID